MIVHEGRTLIREFIIGDRTGGITHMALGSGSTAVLDADTTLQTETKRFVSTGTNGGARKARYDIKVPYNSLSGTTQELGLFTDSTSGNMFLRDVFTALSTGNVMVDIKLVIEIK